MKYYLGTNNIIGLFFKFKRWNIFFLFLVCSLVKCFLQLILTGYLAIILSLKIHITLFPRP